jgi:hypothetical protein
MNPWRFPADVVLERMNTHSKQHPFGVDKSKSRSFTEEEDLIDMKDEKRIHELDA